MGDVERDTGSSKDDTTPASVDDTTEAPEQDDLDVGAVPEKIGEGGTNLRDRNAALSRRRGRSQQSQ
jgi:hypothetical protein